MSDGPSPDISVIIPTYNRRSALERAVASCFEENDAVSVEVVVVDDGSTDETQAWVESLADTRIRYRRQENQGAPVARNRGLEIANGEYVKFLDDDDWLLPGVLECEVNCLRTSGAHVSYGGVKVQEGSGEAFLFIPKSRDLVSGLMQGSVWSHPVVLTYHRKAVHSVQWDPTLEYHQDTDFAMKVASQGLETLQLDRVIGIFNDHGGVRITTTKKEEASVPELVRHRVSSILMGIDRLQEHDALQPYHRRAAAKGLWQWAYVVSPHDARLFEEIAQTVEEVQPEFTPPRSWALIRLLDRLGSPSVTEAILRPIRRAMLRLRNVTG
jgi:hypothetical protein